MAGVARPDTILAWYRRLIARKFDGSKRRSYPGRPTIDGETEALIALMASENSGWGYDRIVGDLASLGHRVSDQTVAIRSQAIWHRTGTEAVRPLVVVSPVRYACDDD